MRKLSNGEATGAQATMKLPPARDEHLDIGAPEELMTGRLRATAPIER